MIIIDHWWLIYDYSFSFQLVIIENKKVLTADICGRRIYSCVRKSKSLTSCTSAPTSRKQTFRRKHVHYEAKLWNQRGYYDMYRSIDWQNIGMFPERSEIVCNRFQSKISIHEIDEPCANAQSLLRIEKGNPWQNFRHVWTFLTNVWSAAYIQVS